MDRVGFEPTTSAIAFSSCTYVSKRATKEREIYCSNPTRSTLFLIACSIALTVKRSLKKKLDKAVKTT
jgi:hypothetical protein